MSPTRNPLVQLPAAQGLAELARREPEVGSMLYALLRAMGDQASAQAERSWRQRKGPMAAYWRAVSVYARHTAAAIRRCAL